MTVMERVIACAGGAAFVASAVTSLAGAASGVRLAFFLTGCVFTGLYVYLRRTT